MPERERPNRNSRKMNLRQTEIAGTNLLAVLGPTASGKSDLAIRLAALLDGEIISADSMQIYRGLDIGTAKPPQDILRNPRHHLVDTLDISERLDVFAYKTAAEQTIADISSRGKLPILSGGTGLYARAVIYGLDQVPSDRELRQKLEDEFAGEDGTVRLRTKMETEDVEDLRRWYDNPRRLIRSYEVFLLTGKPLAQFQKLWADAEPRYNTLSLRLEWDREILKKRISERTVRMLDSGWIEEARVMIGKGLLTSPTARQSLGYDVIGEYLAGQISRKEMEDRIINETWHYARRQMTWFRNKHPEAVSVQMPADAAEIAGLASEFFGAGTAGN